MSIDFSVGLSNHVIESLGYRLDFLNSVRQPYLGDFLLRNSHYLSKSILVKKITIMDSS